MMEGWKKGKLSDSAIVYSGYAFKSKDMNTKSGIPLIKIKNINFHKVSKECDSYLNIKVVNNKQKKYVLKKDDILVAMTGQGSVGRIGKMRNVDAMYLVNQRVGIVRIDEKVASAEYVYQYMGRNAIESVYYNLAMGAGQPNLSPKDIGNLDIYYPPLSTQRKIAKILSAYDDLIENNLKRVKLLEEMAQITYEEWFVRMKFPGHENAVFDKETGLPEGWERLKLGKIAKINSQSLKNDFNGEMIYIDIAGVSPNRIDSKTKYEFAKAPGRARRIVEHGDIIWSCVRPNRKSHAVIWHPEKNLIASTGFCVISPEKLPTSYLYQFLTTDLYVGYLTNLAGGAAYPAVKPIHFHESEIIVPSDELISKYEKKHGVSLELSWNLQIQNQRIKEARDILLPRLMTGMIDVEKLEIEV